MKNRLIWAGVIVVAIVAGYFAVTEYIIPYREAQKEVAEFLKAEKAYTDAMTADTAGGKTPQETLDLFVAALRKEDVQLAAGYFMLDLDLSRQKWVDFLQGVKDKGLMQVMADDIEKKTRSTSGENSDQHFFEILNKDGVVSVSINMRINRYSKLWKIESI